MLLLEDDIIHDKKLIMNKHTKKSIFILIITGILIVIALVILFARKSGTLEYDSDQFAVKDTSSVEKIFIADHYGKTILLEKQSTGEWTVNKKFIAIRKNVSDLLDVIQNVAIREPVAFSARSNVNKWLATGSTKVEIYFQDFRIKLGDLKIWKYQNKKVYYIGSITQDNLGNYALMEGGEEPFIIYMPGFRGFISPYYSPFEIDWKSHNIVKLKISKIKKITLVDYQHSEESFSIVRSGERFFDILTKENQRLPAYDTAKLFDHLSEYRDLNFEFFADELTQGEKDTIFSMRYKDIIVVDMNDNQTKISLFYMENVLDTANYIYHEDFIEQFNKDKFYAIINDNKGEVVICQYFVFDRIIQPLRYYFPDNEMVSIPK